MHYSFTSFTLVNYNTRLTIVNSFYLHRLKNKRGQKFADFIKNVDFQNKMKIGLCWRLIFEILIIQKPTLGSRDVPHKSKV